MLRVLEVLSGPLSDWLVRQFPGLSPLQADLIVAGFYLLTLALGSTAAWRAWRSFRARASKAADGRKITVLIADLAGDGRDLRYTRKLLDELDRALGWEAFVVRRYTDVLNPKIDGDQVKARLEAEDTARRWLRSKNADLLIWGRIDPAVEGRPVEYVLEFTLRAATRNSVERSAFEHSTRFPVEFTSVLGNAVAALVAVEMAPISDRPGQYIEDELQRAVDRLRPLVASRDLNLSWSAQGSLFNAFGSALSQLGLMRGDERLIEEAIEAFRAALTEWTRDRVPLDWAKTQNNLGIALGRLWRLNRVERYADEAEACFRAVIDLHTERGDQAAAARARENLEALQAERRKQGTSQRMAQAFEPWVFETVIGDRVVARRLTLPRGRRKDETPMIRRLPFTPAVKWR